MASGGGDGGASPSASTLQLEGKLIVVGDSNSGKTSIINAWVKGEMAMGTARPTIGVAFSKKNVQLPGANVAFQVWDTAGQVRRLGRS